MANIDGKESACSAGDLGSIPELGRSPGEANGNPLQYCFPENFMDRGRGTCGPQAKEPSGTRCAPGVSRATPAVGDARPGWEGLGKGPLGLWPEAWEGVLRGHACGPDLGNSKGSFSGESVTGRGGGAQALPDSATVTESQHRLSGRGEL